MSADARKASSKHDEPVADSSSTLRVEKIIVIDNTAFIEMQFPSSEPIADVDRWTRLKRLRVSVIAKFSFTSNSDMKHFAD